RAGAGTARWQPHGKLTLGHHAVLLDELGVCPDERRVRAADALARVHQLAHRVRARRRACIEATRGTLFGAVTHERGEIAHVDVLQRISGTARRKHLAATCSARDPVREAIGAVAWPDD